MAHDVIMPQMGESIAEGTITAWLKSVGDEVAQDEPLFEISTDKVDAEIPAPASGVLLEIRAQPGETVAIETVVAVIGAAGEKPSAAPSAAAKDAADGQAPGPTQVGSAQDAPRGAQAPTSSAPSTGDDTAEARRKTKSSPLVRRIAQEHGVTVSQVPGTGMGGRVTKKDILAFIESGGAAGAGSAVVAGGGPVQIPDAWAPRVMEGDHVEKLSTMRSKIAEHMVLSQRVSAHVSTVYEVDFTQVAELIRKHKESWRERHGAKLTYTAFIMKAAVDALKAMPIINASLRGQEVIYHRAVNLGLAVALDAGLIVPVVHGADELNMLGLARKATDLAERARNKKLLPDEVQRGTFTITNPGVFGSLFGLPIINQPQVAIMGVGGVEKRPVVIDDMIAIRTRAYLSLSYDHRLVDGAVADQFMNKVKGKLEAFDETEL